MKKQLYLLLPMICILLAGCGNEKGDPNMEVAIEAAQDTNTSEKNEMPDDETDFSYADELGYQISRSKEYKTNKHVFLYKRK